MKARYCVWENQAGKAAKVFAETDDIIEAVEMLNACVREKLDTEYGVLPPDWDLPVKVTGNTCGLEIIPNAWCLVHDGQTPLCWLEDRGVYSTVYFEGA